MKEIIDKQTLLKLKTSLQKAISREYKHRLQEVFAKGPIVKRMLFKKYTEFHSKETNNTI